MLSCGQVGEAEELQLASARPDGTLRPYVTMWVVWAGDDLYVRSACGPNNPWFRRAKASGAGRIRAGGLGWDVTLSEAAPDVHAAIDAAYHAKYDRDGPRVVGAAPVRLPPLEVPHHQPLQKLLVAKVLQPAVGYAHMLRSGCHLTAWAALMRCLCLQSEGRQV